MLTPATLAYAVFDAPVTRSMVRAGAHISSALPALLLFTLAAFATSACHSAQTPAESITETAAAASSIAPSAAAAALVPAEPHELAMPNGWLAAGQPSAERVAALVDAGVVIITMRDVSEESFDEAALVTSRGGTFERLPTSGESFVDPAFRAQLYTLLDSYEGQPVYLHCASANRVGAAWALYQAEHKGVALDEAITMGRAAGMTRLEDTVRTLLAP